MKKRWLSLALAFVLAFSLFPAAALAADTTIRDYFAGMPLTADGGTGTTAWVVDGDQVKSGSKGKAYSTSTLTLTFTADTAVSFEYKVSSEAKYDKCTITLGSETIADAVSGEIDWTGVTREAKTGDKLTVQYTKDSYGDKGDDCVYLRSFSCGTPLTVTFHNGSDAYTQNIFGGSGALKENTFAEAGKVFAGWASGAESTEVAYADGAGIALEANIDLYAVWADAYTVTFDNNGVTSTVDVAQNYAIGAGNIPTDPTLKGYVFGGWFHGDTQLTAETVISAPVTYTAKWTPISYTIRFHANGGEGTVEEISAQYDQDITLPTCGFTRAGYQFNGWGTYASASSGDAAGKTVKNLTSTEGAVVDYYAAWAGLPVQVTIDLNYAGGENYTRTGVVGKNYNYVYNESTGGADFRSLPTPTRTGYIFKGWFTAAEGGSEIGTTEPQYGFTAEDAKNGTTMYAHWEKGIIVHFDGNGYNGTIYDKTLSYDKVFSSLPSLSSYYYPEDKTLDGWYIVSDGEPTEKVTADTVFTGDEVTLIAVWRNYQYVVKFNIKYSEKDSVTGTMADTPVEFGVDFTLPACTYARDGYRFKGWAESSYTPTVKYADGATIHREYDSWDSEDGESYNLYAIWEQTVFGKAFEAIAAKLPAENIVRSVGALGLPTSGEGYTVQYTCSAAAYITEELNVVALPEHGSTTVTLTAVVTDTSDNSSETRDYILTIYSAETTEAEAELNAAANALTGNFKPVYGIDSNAVTAMEQKLLSAGYEGITVSVKEAVSDTNNYCGIGKDGAIHYYFNPGMTGSGGYFYTTFLLSKYGVTVEKEWYTSLNWDLGKVQTELDAAADTLRIPETAETGMTLPQIVDGKSWAKVIWESSDATILKVGAAASYNSPYPVTILSQESSAVVLTATLQCNSVSGVTATREFDCAVPGNTGASISYQEKLDAALAVPGLTDAVTGEVLDRNWVVNDILFPTTRTMKIDGKYTPVVISSSDEDTIAAPDTPNAARVDVYRPLPGEAAKTVTLTIQILDRPNGPQRQEDLAALDVLASQEITVTVQPLTQLEIDNEISLLEQVKTHYFDGIKNANSEEDNITTDLQSFQECYLGEDGQLVWVYSHPERKNHGIVPDELDDWYDQQIWRLFRSSNNDVISHENLLVTRAEESKAVTITSYLSSETLGKYAEKYPENTDFQKLYKQPVCASLVVTGTNYAQGTTEAIQTLRKQAANAAKAEQKKLTISFTLDGGNGFGFQESNLSYAEGTTVYDVFSDLLTSHGYTSNRCGSYIASITNGSGITLAEFDEGKNSGWMYRINGELSSKYMSSQGLQDQDEIVVFFTADYTREPGSNNWSAANSTDQKAADAVSQQIAAIGTVDEKSGEAIKAARSAYDRLTAAQQKLVRNYDLLSAAEQRYAVLTGQSPAFPDVSQEHWAYDAVRYVYQHQVMFGDGNGNFAPNDTMSRAMAWTALSRIAGDPLSESETAWYDAPRIWVQNSGLSDGTHPMLQITREQMATMLYRYACASGFSTEERGNLSPFGDADKVSLWAEEAMSWAVGCELIQGRDVRKLAPQDNLSRAEAAALFYRFLHQFVNS